MPIPAILRKRLLAMAGAGAFAVALALLGGPDGIEGRRYAPYQDVAGMWTVCDGHTGADIVRNKIYTDPDCDVLLHTDLQNFQSEVDSLVKVSLSDYQRAALYSFAYNVGIEAFTRSTLLKKLNSGDIKGACDEMRRWVYAGGRKWRGLMSRRDIERSLCLAESADDLKG